MRKALLALMILALFAAPSAFAEFGYGIHFGGGIAMYDSYEANASGALTQSTASDMGVHFGGSILYPMNEKLVFKGDLGYATFFVGDDDYSGPGYEMKISSSLSDIYITGDANYMFNDKYYGIAGIGIHMYTFTTDVESTIAGFPTTTTSYDSGDTKFGLNLGGGMKLNEKISLEATYGIIADIRGGPQKLDSYRVDLR